MSWFASLSTSHTVAHAVLVLCLIAVAGLVLGRARARGIGLGTAGVLFAGIGFGHVGLAIDPSISEFVREFGLILFVFTIGLELGPSFFASLRKEGLRLNAMAAVIVALGALGAALATLLTPIENRAALGLFSGATTNTPSLGAASQALASLGPAPPAQAALPALAYAVGYPVGIVGIIGSLLFLRLIFRIDPVIEAEKLRVEHARGLEPLERVTLRVEKPNLDGVRLDDVHELRNLRVVVSRIRRAGEVEVHAAVGTTTLRLGDTILAVGRRRDLERAALMVGRSVDVDLMTSTVEVTFRRLVVTRSEVLGESVAELGLDHRFGVTVTRVERAGVEMTGVEHLRLKFGDRLQVVGAEDSLAKVEVVVGNSVKALDETHFIPMFLGIALGVLAGLAPLRFPGLPVPVRLGLAGGPLVVAILLGRVGRVGPLVWHIPANANRAFRELGITLFLACVGLKAGSSFFATVLSTSGLLWLGAAAVIAIVPLLVIGVLARVVLRMNYVTITGLLAGSMTDPPALAFANAICKSEAPSVAYATVYPLTMLLRIVVVQALALLLCR